MRRGAHSNASVWVRWFTAVVHPDRDLTERRRGLTSEASQLVSVRDVGGDGDGSTTHRDDLVAQRFERCEPTPGQRDVGAGPCKTECDPPPDAGATAGDHRNSPITSEQP